MPETKGEGKVILEDNKTAFKRGLKKNSFIIIIIALILSLGLCLLVDRSIKNGLYLNLTQNQFDISGTDDYASRATYNTYQQKFEGDGNYPVYLMGGSTSFFLTNGTIKFADYLARDTDTDFTFVDLTADGQKMSEALLLLNNLPEGRGTLIIGITYRRFVEAMDLSRYPLDNTETLRFLEDSGQLSRESESFAVAHHIVFNDLVTRGLDKLFFADILGIKETQTQTETDYEADSYDYRMTGAELEDKVSNIRRILGQINADSIDRFELTLGEIARVCDKKGITLVILDLPVSEALYGDFIYEDKPLGVVMNEICQTVEDNYDNVCYTRYAYDLGIGEDDYREGFHVGNPEKLDLMRRGLAGIVAKTIDQDMEQGTAGDRS